MYYGLSLSIYNREIVNRDRERAREREIESERELQDWDFSLCWQLTVFSVVYALRNLSYFLFKAA